MTSTPPGTSQGRRAPLHRDAIVIGSIGAALRVAVVVWAAGRFPPVEDGRFYHQLATRIAEGQGYTWRWPDGVVTFVAHYPVGYPGLLASLYATLGPSPTWGMLLNAALGALGVIAVHRVVAASSGRVGAGLAATAVAIHPALVLYTPALMTEGVTAALFAIAAWVVVLARGSTRPVGWWVLLGGLLGLTTLVRGQSLLVMPVFAVMAGWTGRAPSWRSLTRSTLVTTLATACVVLPWTFRNCQRMDRCVVVSANVGWNLLIGATEGATGTFVPISGESVPEACRNVFGEADKDACFAREAIALVRARPMRWLGLVPRKLAHTFEYCGAAGWYLRASSPGDFSERAKLSLGIAETVLQRALLLLALVSVGRTPGSRATARKIGVGLAAPLLLTPFAWIAYVVLAVATALLGRRLIERPALGLGVAVLAATLVTHAAFFGAGRYSLVVFPLVAAMAGTAIVGRREAEDRSRFDISRATG